MCVHVHHDYIYRVKIYRSLIERGKQTEHKSIVQHVANVKHVTVLTHGLSDLATSSRSLEMV